MMPKYASLSLYFSLVFSLFLCFSTAQAQSCCDNFTTVQNGTVCSGGDFTLDVKIPTCDQYTLNQTGTFDPVPGTGTIVSLTDDELSMGLPIGFNFTFFSHTYSVFYISSNGYISFTGPVAFDTGGCCAGQSMPNSELPNNLIAFAWEDLDPSANGSINYFTTGTAPFRQLVVNFVNVAHSGLGGTAYPVTSQVILYETTNIIEIHTTGMNSDDGGHSMGIENADGTEAITVPSRTPDASWSLANDYVAFEPTGEGGCEAANVVWTNNVDATTITGSTATVQPIITTTYTASITCGSITCTQDVVVTIDNPSTPVLNCQDITVGLDAAGVAQIDFDNALHFDGLDDVVVVGDDPSLQWVGAVTVEAWIYVDGTTLAHNTIVGKIATAGQGFWLNLEGAVLDDNVTANPDAYKLRWVTGSSAGVYGSLYSSNTISFNSWTHVAAVYDESEMRIYINGSQAGSLSYSDGMSSDNGLPIAIGASSTNDNISPPNNFPGAIDGVRIWNIARTQDEIQTYMNQELTAGPASLLGCWNFNDGPGSIIAVDVSNYNNTGVLSYMDINSDWQSSHNVIDSGSATKCGITSTVTNPNTFDCHDIGANFITMTIQDNTNTYTCESTVTVTDDEELVVSCPADVNTCTETVTLEAPTSNDYCDAVFNGYSILVGAASEAISSPATFEEGTTIVTVTYSSTSNDVANPYNITECTFNVTYNGPIVSTTSLSDYNGVNISCTGNSDGTATVEPTGGFPPYSYLWDIGQNTQTATNLSAGTYVVTVTDSEGCTEVVSNIVLAEPSSALSATVSQTNVSCAGASDASITANPTGGTAPYTYGWTIGGVYTQTISGLAAGIYNLVVTDANNCQTTLNNIVITEPTELSITTTETNAVCNVNNSAASTANVSGGTAPYTYLWSNGATTASINNLSAGTYSVTVTDDNACTAAISDILINEPLAVNVMVNDVLCYGGSDGSIETIITGGVAPYSYSWSDINTQNTAIASNLSAGTYTLIVTDSNDCTATTSATVNDGEILSSLITSTIDDASCHDNDGQATINIPAVCGLNNRVCTTPNNYDVASENNTSYEISPFKGAWSDARFQYLISADELRAAGVGEGTIGSLGFEVINKNSTTPYQNFSIRIKCTDLEAFDSNLALFEAGLHEVYTASSYTSTVGWNEFILDNTFDWDGLTNIVVDICFNNEAVNVSLDDEIATSATNYLATAAITDDGTGLDVCSFSLPVNTYAERPNIRFGACNIAYTWSSGQTSATATGLSAGNYTVTVSFTNGCEVVENISVGTLPSVSVSINDYSPYILCYGDSNGYAIATASGGTAPYTYLWNNNQTTATASNLPAGTYTLTVTDADNCTSEASVTIDEGDIFVTQATTSYTTASCIGASDGTATLSLPLTCGTNNRYCSSPNTYALATDGNALNNADFTPYKADYRKVRYQYLYTANELLNAGITPGTIGSIGFNVLNKLSTQAFSNFTIKMACTAATALNATAFEDGLLTVYQQDYTSVLGWNMHSLTNSFDWNGVDNLIVEICFDKDDAELNSDLVATSTTNYVSALRAINNDPTAPLNACDMLVADSYSERPDIQLGYCAITYNWLDANNTAINQTTSTATNLEAGYYSVDVTLSNGCVFNESILVLNAPPMEITINTASTLVCFQESSGMVEATVANGTAPYNYVWSNGTIGEINSNLAAGPYTVTVTDANNCSASEQIILQNATPMVCSINASDLACFGDTNGTATAVVGGSVAPYTFNWTSDGGYNATGNSIDNLAGDTYHVVITDAIGCTCQASATVFEPEPLTVISDGTNASEGVDGGILSVYYNVNVIAFTGGTLPYSYEWQTSGYVRYEVESPGTINVIYADNATFTVTVSDLNGCGVMGSPLVFSSTDGTNTNTQNILNITDYTVSPDNGNATGAVNVVLNGGTAPYTYEWSGPNDWLAPLPNNDLQTVTSLPTGWYSVTVTDSSNPQQTTIGWYWVPLEGRGRNKEGLKMDVTMEVFPNPAVNETMLTFAVNSDTQVNASLHDMQGKKILNLFDGVVFKNYVHSIPVKVTNLSSGIYLLSISTENGNIQFKKLIIQ